MDRNALIDILIHDEGLRLSPYRDSVGLLTIGVGHCLDRNPITRGAALYILNDDIDIALSQVDGYPWWDAVKNDPVRANVILSMAFNLGLATLRQFHQTLAAIADKRWADAAKGMRDSRWATQVGARAERLAKMMETGKA